MWEIYDALIEKIPDDLTVDEIVVGNGITYVESNGGSGSAPYRNYTERAPQYEGDKFDLSLKEVAELVKSWNFVEASVGNAALLAYYNHPDRVRAKGILSSDKNRVEDRLKDPFINSQKEIQGKKVCVVGHFPLIENLFEPVCDLSIIEWDPGIGDYPYTACEYLIPESDYVYFTCASIVDKSLPRILELSENAKKITMVGPATPLAEQFFDYGIDDLSAFVILDNERAKRIVSGAEFQRIYASGKKVNYLSSARSE